MIKLAVKLPRKLWVACSGGPDSMAAVSFLDKNHDINVIHINHNTENSTLYHSHVDDFCTKNSLSLTVKFIDDKSLSFIQDEKNKGKEWSWAKQRHEIFSKLDAPVVLGHHLDDAVETWIMSCMIGNPRLMNVEDHNVIRPFILNRKSKLVSHCMSKFVPYIHDQTNDDGISNSRSVIRKNMEVFLKLNPGIHSTVRNKLKERLKI